MPRTGPLVAMPVLPGGTGRVQARHAAALRGQMEAMAVARLQGRGHFRQVVADPESTDQLARAHVWIRNDPVTCCPEG